MHSLVAVALAGLLLVGCNSGETPPAPDGAKGKVVTEVPKEGGIPAEGIQLQPKDPNDPKFKQDPRLSGGGGN